MPLSKAFLMSMEPPKGTKYWVEQDKNKHNHLVPWGAWECALNLRDRALISRTLGGEGMRNMACFNFADHIVE